MAAKNTRIERILDPFGAMHSNELVVFFNRVAGSNFDIVLFIARKALCLYRLMDLCGVKKPAATLCSDAISDDPIQFSGQKVLVVDDTLFVGTTLADVKDKIIQHGPKELAFWVYCVDIDTWNPATFAPDYIHIKGTSHEITEFCSAECRSMINAGIPYLTDFAFSKRIGLYPSELDASIKPVNWYFYDISSQYHESNKVKYYSAIPDNFIHQDTFRFVGPQIFDLIEMAKLRVFAAWTGQRYDVTFVPVVTFGSIKIKDVKYATQALLSLFEIDEILVSSSSTNESVRVLQFLVGAVYLNTFFSHLERIRNLKASEKLDFAVCSSVFRPNLALAISIGIAKLYEGSLKTLPRKLPPLRTNEPKQVAAETRDDISSFLMDYFACKKGDDFQDTALSDLTAIFLEFHAKFEKPARKEIADNVKRPIHRNRLKRGMAWGALSSYVLDKHRIENTRYKRNLLSLYLDKLIDYGIAVPIIANSNGKVYRAYRHGEDVRYGAQEENLVYKVLEGFELGRESTGFERTYLEKLIVILLRVGMNEEWLNLWYSRSGRDNLVRVGYNLQGAVPITPKSEDELIPEGATSWLTRRLCRVGTVLEPCKKGGVYELGDEPEATHARKDAGRTAKLLGYAIGKACISGSKQRNADRPIGTEDLIIITSCANLTDTVSAAAAEMQLFADWYREYGQKMLRGYVKRKQAGRGSTTVRRSIGEEAVNSGTWKIRRLLMDSGLVHFQGNRAS